MPWIINARTAMVTALAAGGLQPAAGLAPGDPSITITDLEDSTLQQTLAAGGTLSFPWPAVLTLGQVNGLGFFSADPANTQLDTRINGVPVRPFIAHLGAIGSIENPFLLSSPIVLQAGDVFDVLLTNLDPVNPIQVQVRTIGWRR